MNGTIIKGKITSMSETRQYCQFLKMANPSSFVQLHSFHQAIHLCLKDYSCNGSTDCQLVQPVAQNRRI